MQTEKEDQESIVIKLKQITRAGSWDKDKIMTKLEEEYDTITDENTILKDSDETKEYRAKYCEELLIKGMKFRI